MILTIQNLTIGYKKQKPLAQNITIDAPSGQAIALIGDNGEGKSTLLRTIALLQKAKSGDILLDGTSLTSMTVAQRAKVLSFVSTERISIAYTTVRQIVELGRIPFSTWSGKISEEDTLIVDKALELTQTTELQDRTIDTLSDGQRQRVMIARALAQSTPVLLLDEPTAFLDPKNRTLVIELLNSLAKKMDKIILYSTHEVELCQALGSKVWQLENGQLSEL